MIKGCSRTKEHTCVRSHTYLGRRARTSFLRISLVKVWLVLRRKRAFDDKKNLTWKDADGDRVAQAVRHVGSLRVEDDLVVKLLRDGGHQPIVAPIDGEVRGFEDDAQERLDRLLR